MRKDRIAFGVIYFVDTIASTVSHGDAIGFARLSLEFEPGEADVFLRGFLKWRVGGIDDADQVVLPVKDLHRLRHQKVVPLIAFGLKVAVHRKGALGLESNVGAQCIEDDHKWNNCQADAG